MGPITFKEKVQGRKILSPCILKNVIPRLLLNDSLAVFSIQVRSNFPSEFKVLLCYLLTSRDAIKNSGAIMISCPLCTPCLFFSGSF